MFSRMNWMSYTAVVCCLAFAGANDGYGQAGDRKDRPGTEQKAWVPEEVIPEAPVLSPEEALESFSLPAGFEIEIAAAEPFINSPVAMEFDEAGRMWVVEMTGYMPNADGTGEDARVGSIVTLEDTDKDGRVDKRTVFLDKLQMPRAICLIDDGVLVAEPPYLWFCKDTDGDGKSDKKEIVDDKYGSQGNPEHTSNGLMVALDNWIYSANHGSRYKKINGQWIKEATSGRGQWGISQDNYGRIYFNSNSDQLRVDLFPTHYLSQNPNIGRLSGGSYRTTSDQTVWPSRVNPGVNRAYRRGTLRDEDYTLARYTGASGPVVYRGDNFPAEFVGNGFVPEPTGNFIRRNILTEIDGTISATNAYFQSEFLASTDERFRPVNLYNGPDGCLYVVDLYRGLIQHRIFLTTYLRNQIESRGLENPIHLGRIYRVVWKGGKQPTAPVLSKSEPANLVKALSHKNGWTRDTAQRLLIELGPKAPVSQIRRVALKSKSALGRRHALWTMEGLGKINKKLITQALEDWDGKNRAIAIRLAESYLDESNGNNAFTKKILSKSEDPSFEVRQQLAFSIHPLPARQRAETFAKLMLFGSQNEWLQNAALSSIAGAEYQFLNLVANDRAWNISRDTRNAFVQRVANSIRGSKDAKIFLAASHLAIDLPQSAKTMTEAILDGLASPMSRNNKPTSIVQLDSEPKRLVSASTKHEKVKKMLLGVTWGESANTDRTNTQGNSAKTKLGKVEQELFNKGQLVYTTLCGACHQPNGEGQEGLAPPLKNSEWVSGSKERLTRIVLQGMQGPVEVDGKEYNLLMPGLAVLEDEQIASVLTYVRNSFGHASSAISVDEVAKTRLATQDKGDLWTAQELLEVK